MKTDWSTALPSIARRLPLWRMALSAACVLSLGTAQAARSDTAIPAGRTISVPATHSLKEQLTRLRDITVHSLVPVGHSTDAEWNQATDSGNRFSAKEQLFRPISKPAHADKLQRLLKQQLGFQIGRNAQFQCDLDRYRTADDQREVRVKLGVNVGFR